MSQMQPVHTFTPYFPKIHSNTILPSTRRSSEWSLPFKLFQPKLYMQFSSLSCMLHAPPIQCTFVSITPPTFVAEYMLWSSSLCSLLQTSANSSHLCPNILLFSNTLNFCSWLSVRGQFSHPYKATGKVIVFVMF